MNDPQLFESTPEGQRRSVLFSLAIMTGFITVAAAVAAYVGANQALVAIVLGVIGVGAVGFAVLLFLGRLSGFVEEDQLLWRLAD